MYLGFLLGNIIALVMNKISNTIVNSMLIASVTILVVEIVAEKQYLLPFGNIVRFETGIIVGISVGIGIVSSIKNIGGNA